MEEPVGRTPATEATLTTDPWASRRAGRAATVMAHVPKTLTSKMRRHTSTEAACEVVVRDHGGGPRIVHERVEPAPALERGGHQTARGRPAR